MIDPIKVWRFHDAPPEYKELSNHGGDEDWLALVPPGYSNEWISWAEDGSPFGCCSVSRHELANGSYVLIGAHS
jgi:hypothetical protein